jgi:hypothetical protein
MIQLYKSCVCTVSDYGAEIWFKDQKSYLSKLQSLQNKAARKILGAFSTTPISALEAEAAILPINLRLKHQQRRYALRILTLDQSHPIRKQAPDTLPPDYIIGPDYEENSKFQQWFIDQDQNKPFRTTIERILAGINKFININSILEDYHPISYL